MNKYIVSTVSSFIIKYAIEAKSKEDAINEFVMNEHTGYMKEISSVHISENIADVRQVGDIDIIEEAEDYMKDFALNQINILDYSK